jgi:hypothetical protein
LGWRGASRNFMFVKWTPFWSRELTSAQGMNIAGFEFGCAIDVGFGFFLGWSGLADQLLREPALLLRLFLR